MKKTHLRIGMLTACLIGVGSVASAQSCGVESCDSKSCSCSKKHCDDKGLLEVINNAASNFEAKLASMIPDRDKPCRKTKCECAKCSMASDFAMQYTEEVPLHVPHSTPYGAPHIAPPMAQPDVVRPPMPRMMAPTNPILDPVPVPHSGIREVVPLPESRIDPFKDDPTTRNLRAVPARPASYLRPNSDVPTDPQARDHKSKRSILMSKAASKSISDSTHGLAKTTSTRRPLPSVENISTQFEQSVFKQSVREVVPASLTVPVSSLRNPTPLPPASEQFVNPLRAQ